MPEGVRVTIPLDLVERMCQVRQEMLAADATMWECSWKLEDGTVIALDLDV